MISGSSYLSQKHLRIHFGLGEHERVDKAPVTGQMGQRTR
ncbi:MAG: ASPIC/UnbV domain-containing protein [Candidatus Sulfotelmatobacter sp.]